MARKLEALEKLAHEAEVATQSPEALEEVAVILAFNGKTEAAVRLLRRAQEAHPGDFWINDALGSVLGETHPPQHDEAIRFLSVAVALRSKSAGAWNARALLPTLAGSTRRSRPSTRPSS